MKVFIALGSNLGDRLSNLNRSAATLQALSRSSIQQSSLYETTPDNCPPNSPTFLNAVIAMEVDDRSSPIELLSKLKAIEEKLGRKPKQVLNEPRLIDLDLICCGDVTLNTADLVLPHPRAHLRRFVLQPLCDIAPNLVLPNQTKTVSELLAALPADESVRLFARKW